MSGTYLYDHVVLLEGTSLKMVEAMYQNNLRQHTELEEGLDQDMEDAWYEDEECDLDYEPPASGVSLNDLMEGMRNMQLFITQRFDALDVQFMEINQRFDAQDAQFRKIGASIQRWENATTVGLSPSQNFS